MKHKFLKGLALSLTLASSPALAADETVAFSVPNLGFPFFVHMQNEFNAAGEKLGVTVENYDGQNQTTKQTSDVEAMIIGGVDGIVISPLDSVAMAPAVRQAVEAGIPVITVDRAVEGVDVLGHVGADNVKGGEAQADLITKLFPDGARIVNLQGQPGASPAIDRNAGLHNILDGMSDKYEIVAEQTANFAREEGASVTEAILAGLDSPPDVTSSEDSSSVGDMR